MTSLLKEFSKDLVEANGGHEEGIGTEPTEWPESWGTLGEPSAESPFQRPEPATRVEGQHLTHKCILSLEDSRKLDMLFHATGPDFVSGFKSFMTAHRYAVFRVPLPDFLVEEPADSPGPEQRVRITGPRKGYLPVIGVQMLCALATFAVCCPLSSLLCCLEYAYLPHDSTPTCTMLTSAYLIARQETRQRQCRL